MMIESQSPIPYKGEEELIVIVALILAPTSMYLVINNMNRMEKERTINMIILVCIQALIFTISTLIVINDVLIRL